LHSNRTKTPIHAISFARHVPSPSLRYMRCDVFHAWAYFLRGDNNNDYRLLTRYPPVAPTGAAQAMAVGLNFLSR
jgi:hypothetical protein